MTVKDIVAQIEMAHGEKSHAYLFRLINDALLDIASKKQHYTVSAVTDLASGTRWYDLPARTVDVVKVEILDTSTSSRYHLIPKLTNPHKLLKSDPDTGTGDLS